MSSSISPALPIKKRIRIFAGDIVDRVARPSYDTRTGFRVLLYHSVTDSPLETDLEENTIDKKLFEEQMGMLNREKFNVISCKEAVVMMRARKSFPPGTVAIAFDDGYRDNLRNALPTLKRFGFPATIFVATDFITDNDSGNEYITPRDVEELKKTNIIDFGCHSKTHSLLRALDDESLDNEISGAKNALRDITGRDICLFAYPYGHSASYDKKTIERMESAGFLAAFTTIFGFNGYSSNPYLLHRNRISWLDGMPEFIKHLNGSYDWCAAFEVLRKKRVSWDKPKNNNMDRVLSSANERFIIGRAANYRKEDIFDFFRHAYQDQFNARDFTDEGIVIRRWNWQNLENPNIKDTGFPAWFCKDRKSGEIVGHLGVMPVSIKIGKSTYPAVWGRDMIVPAKFRKSGAGSMLFKAAMDQTKDKAALFLLAGLNDYAVTIYKRLGFIHLGYIPLYVRPIKITNLLSRYVNNRFLLSIMNLLTGIALGIFNFIVDMISGLRRKNVVVKEITSFDRSFDSLWEKASSGLNIAVTRNSDSLKWRFVEQPYWKYRIFKAEDVSKDELKGYIVLREGKSQGLRLGIISDIFACPDDTATIKELLVFAAGYFRKNSSVDLLRCDILNNKFERCLKNTGFICITSKSHFMVSNTRPGIDRAFIHDRKNWFLTYADCDLDLSGNRN